MNKQERRQFQFKLGDNLKFARFRKGYTQEQVAAMLGMTAVGYGGYERGDRDIPTLTMYRLTKILDVSADWLLKNENHRTD